MLVGRKSERRRIAALLKNASKGISGALVLRGEAGIGKSALLSWALEFPAGLRTSLCRPVESESEISFSGLSDLLGPLRSYLESIPVHQAQALASALSLGPPVAGDRFAVYAATMSLLAAAAYEAPVLVAVDDAQWLDRASAEALLFTARRLEAEGIALLIFLRGGHGSAFEDGGLDELELSGLSVPECTTLLSGRGDPPGQATVEELHQATGGNPLAVLEIAGLLSAGQLAGIEPLGDPLPAAASVERAFLRRLAQLPVEVRRALVVVSVADSDDMAPIAASLRSMGIDSSLLVEAEDRGLIRLKGHKIEFAHPLIRSCVYHAAHPSEQRAAHRALAGTLQTRAPPSDADRATWHLAAAAVEPDEAIAGALEEVALGARERSGYVAAARALARAAELSPGSHDRARRLLDAAEAALLGGQTARANSLLLKASEAAVDRKLSARIQHARGRTEMWQGKNEEAFRILTTGASKYRETDPLTSCLMLVDATMTCGMRGDVEGAVATGERAWRAAQALGGHAQVAAAVLYASGLLLQGHTARVSDLLNTAGEPLEVYTLTGHDLLIPTMAAHLLAWSERYDDALRVIALVTKTARGTGALGALPMALATQADTEFDIGDWNAAYAHALEAIELARATGQESALSYCLVVAAEIEAPRGLAEECSEHTDVALNLVGIVGDGSILTFAGGALGALELGLGRYGHAAVELRKVAELLTRLKMRHPGLIRWAPDLIEALAHLGSQREARKVLRTLEVQSERVGTPWAKAAVSRCRGILADDDFEGHFETALRTHQQDVLPFERARTELAYGERLRRSRRRADSRTHLRKAHEIFERLGAAPWADRASAELRATGERARRRDPTTALDLTPQEHMVAEAVAQGATNKEVAATLFLSPKTIESHLSRIYVKLGVRSRAQLTHRWNLSSKK